MAVTSLVFRAVVMFGFSMACAGSEPEGTGSAVAAGDSIASPVVRPPSVSSTGLPPRDSVSANPVNWTIELVMARLAGASLAPTFAGPVRVRHMRVPGSAISFSGGQLEVYIYGDATAAARDVDELYQRIRLPGGATAWDRPPSLVTANNLAILIHGSDPADMERVRRAFNADHVYPQAPPAAVAPR